MEPKNVVDGRRLLSILSTRKDIAFIAIIGLTAIGFSYFMLNSESQEVPSIVKEKRLLFAVYTTSYDNQTIRILENYLLDENSQADYVIDDTFGKRIFPFFPEQKKILLGASVNEISRINSALARSHHFTSDDIIAYDIENWSSTPAIEQQDAARAISDASGIVHKAGYEFGVTPDQKILFDWYEKIDWSQIDFLALQFQRIANNNDELRNYVRIMTEYVRSQNSDIEIFLQISFRHSNPDGMKSAIMNVADLVDGVIIAYLPDGARPPCRYCSPEGLEEILQFINDYPISSRY
jgi:hypothetical protein